MSEPRAPRLLPEPDAARAMPAPRTPRVMPEPRAARPLPEPRAARAKPDPNPLRLMLGLAGIASASAFASAMLPSVTPSPAPVELAADIVTAAEPAVVHVTRVVQLKPGETAPPQASVIVQPTPTPRVRVVTTTRQSGKP